MFPMKSALYPFDNEHLTNYIIIIINNTTPPLDLCSEQSAGYNSVNYDTWATLWQTLGDNYMLQYIDNL